MRRSGGARDAWPTNGCMAQVGDRRDLLMLARVTIENLVGTPRYGQDDDAGCRSAHRLDASPGCERGASCRSPWKPPTRHSTSVSAVGAAAVFRPIRACARTG